MTRLLALDISSTHIGCALFDDEVFVSATSYTIKGDLQKRLVAIGDLMRELLKLRPELLAIEAPAFASREHVALQRAAGAMLCQWRGGSVQEIAPAAAKVALTGHGRADKDEMIRAAGFIASGCTIDEHAADAVAVGLAALAKLHLAALT
jgi:Holliday junction resolvasome RuvABC endonuclease subunit